MASSVCTGKPSAPRRSGRPLGTHRMNLLPRTQEGRLSLALYPFKVFVLAVPLVAVFSAYIAGWAGWDDGTGGVFRSVWASEWTRWGSMCEKGYVVCIIGLFVGGSYLVDRRARKSALIFAIVAIAFFTLLHIGNKPSKSRSIAGWLDPCVERTEASFSAHSKLMTHWWLASAAPSGR